MAGAGVRVFQPGEVLTAALVNSYLQDQVVARFATVTARNNAFIGNGAPTLEEGRICYLDSTNEMQFYNGTAWVAINSEAVINIITTKGDLVAGTAASTIARLGVGGNDTFLIADSSTATGLKWSTIPADAVTTAKILDSNVTTAKIADSAITSAKIADGAIVNADINASAAIELGKLADATIDEKSASYTLALTDKNKFIKMSVTSTANTVTVPTNASVAFPIGSQIHIIQYGTGKTQVIPVSGTVTIYATPGAYLRAQYSAATLLKCDTNIWMLMGDLSAS